MQLRKIVLSIYFLFGWCIPYSEGQTDVDPLQQKISLKVVNMSISKCLINIENQTEVKFMYNPNDLIQSKPINISIKKQSLKKVLNQLFFDQSIAYKVNGNQIILFKQKSPKGNNNIQQKKKKNIIISGYITDVKTGEALIAAYLYDNKTYVSTTTNNFGFFSITLPLGFHELVASYIGYESQLIKTDSSQNISIKMQQNTNMLEEIIVSSKEASEKEENVVQSAQMGMMRISTEKLKSIPAIAGEQDVLKAITLLPGIKQGVDGNAGFYVRGGGPDQNLVLLDGVPMYNPYHIWGFLSTFNPDAINNIEITKGAFPARYGGRLSSVLDITTKDGNNQEWKKDISLGLLSGRASISGPIKKDKSSVFISVRRTLLDLILAPAFAERSKGFIGQTGYQFGDANLKFNYKLSKKDRVYVSGFYSTDALNYNEKDKDEFIGTQKFEDSQGWKNAFGSVRWNHLYNDRLFSNTTAYYSTYTNFTDRKKEVQSNDESLVLSSLFESNYSSTIKDLALKQDYQWYLNNKNRLRFGLSAIFHTFKPGVEAISQEFGKEALFVNSTDNTTKANEYSAYLENEFQLGKKIKINFGIHSNALQVQDTTFISIQPRLSARALVNDQFSVKFGYAEMSQNLHLLTSSNITRSSDLWVPATKRIRPSFSRQLSAGFAFNLEEKYQVELEGYFKNMDGLIEYKEGSNFLVTTENWEDKVTNGTGQSYGFELFIQKKTGKLSGWLGYTLSWTTREFKEINFGESFLYKYDRRHDISLVANYKLNDNWSLNGTWVFASGNNVSLSTILHINPNYAIGERYEWWQFLDAQNLVFDISTANPGLNKNGFGRNDYKLPDYHRMDLTASRKWTGKKGKKNELIMGLTNAYNKFNPSSIDQRIRTIEGEDGTQIVRSYTQINYFPIMPTISYGLSF